MSEEVEEQTKDEGKIVVVRTTSGREKQVMERMQSRIKRDGLGVLAILNPPAIRGYIFVEAESVDDVSKAIYGITNVRGLVGEIPFKDIVHFLTKAPVTINVKDGDIIEVVSGPFKGEKGKIKRINKTREEVIIELLEAPVPIPITVRIDSVRVLNRGEE